MGFAFLFQRLLNVLGLGFLVGLQRECIASRLAGVCTFPLVTQWEVFFSTLAQSFWGGVLAAGFLALAGPSIIGNIAEYRAGTVDSGRTIEVALLLMFGLGAYLVVSLTEFAGAVVILTLLLFWP